jgi:hypothetical protein
MFQFSFKLDFEKSLFLIKQLINNFVPKLRLMVQTKMNDEKVKSILVKKGHRQAEEVKC